MTFQNINGVRPAVCAAGAPYGWLTPYVAGLAANNENVAARVLYLTRSELHFLALVLSVMGPARDDADHFAAFARTYGVATHKSLLANAAALGRVEALPALANIAPNLAGKVWRPATYLLLVSLMNESQARKSLRHTPRITRRTVFTLARLPVAYRTGAVLKMIKRRRDLGELTFAIELVRRVRTDLTDRQIVVSLEKADGSYIREWVMRHYQRAPFPPAPSPALFIGGVEALRPLGSFDDLARSAREFGNCIRDYLWRVLSGDTYYYRYAPDAGGNGVAVVELKKAPVIGWVVHEALGPGNDPIKSADRAAIVAAFRKEGVGAAPQAVDPNCWFDLG